MARILFVSPTSESVGLTSVALGLVRAFDLAGQRAVFAKPFAQPGREHRGRDHSTALIEMIIGHTPPSPIPATRLEEYLAEDRGSELLEEVIARLTPLHHQAEVLVVEGLVASGDFHFDQQLNEHLVRTLDADVLLVSAPDGRDPHTVAHELSMHRRLVGDRVVGCVINKVPEYEGDPGNPTAELLSDGSSVRVPDEIRAAYRTALEDHDLRLVGCIPAWQMLAAPRIVDVAATLGARFLHRGAADHRRMHSYAVAAMRLHNICQRLRPGHLLVLPGDRHDVILAAAYAELDGTKLAGLLFTGGIDPEAVMLGFCRRAIDQGLPLLACEDDTLTVGKHLIDDPWVIAPDDRDRAELTMSTVASNLDRTWLDRTRSGARARRLSPAAFRHRLISRAREGRRRIVLPEGEEPRTLTAAVLCQQRGIAIPVLLGKRDRIASVAASEGLTLPDDLEIIDPEEALPRYVDPLVERRKHKGLTRSSAESRLADTVVLGTMMLALDEVDGLVSGAVHTTANTIRPALQLIKTAPEARMVSSVFFMCLPDQVLVYGDCAVNPDPTAEELADIALQSAASAESFGIEPRIAMISYSTGTSGAGEEVEKVAEATGLVRADRPELLIDGPLQYDAAVMPDVAAKKAPDSAVAGRATVIVFPDLNTGNTTYKAVQRSAHVVSIGPMLQGLAKPVNDLSRGALVEDIVYTIALTAIQSIGSEREPFTEVAEVPIEGDSVIIRPLEPQDESLLKEFHDTLGDDTVRARYHRHFPASDRKQTGRLHRICTADQIDEIVLGAFLDSDERLLGVGRLNMMQHVGSGETALVVSDAWQGKRVGRRLKEMLIVAARKRGLRTLRSVFDPRNRAAIELARHMGYRFLPMQDDEMVAVLDL